VARADSVLATVTRERARVLAPSLFVSLVFFVALSRPLGIVASGYVYVIEVAILAVLAAVSYGLWTRSISLERIHLATAVTLWCTNVATVVPMYVTGSNLLIPFVITQAAWAGILMDTRYMVATLLGINAVGIPLVIIGGGPYATVFICALVSASLFAPVIHSVIRNALLQIESHREAYESLVESSPDPMFVYDRSTAKIRWVNSAMLNMLGFESGDDLLGKRSLDVFVHPEDRERLQTRRDAVQRGECESGIDVRWMCVDGSVRYVHATSRPVSFDGSAILVVGQDLTEQKQSAERERSLEEQLHQSQRMESIGQLAGGVAHDFNNILAVIMSNAGLLAEDLSQRGIPVEEASEILEAAERGAALTRQLLAFSRKQHRQVATFVLNDVVVDLKTMVRRIVGEDVEVKVDLQDDGGVRADRAQLGQVIMNLVANARDAMPTGGTLTIETRATTLDARSAAGLGLVPGTYLRLSVHDTGVGMSPEVKARIFEPFFTTKDVGKGTGLGLATVFGIVKQSDGAISCDSAPGKGTRFRIYLPRIAGVTSVPTVPRTKTGENPMLGTGTILLVEDEAQVRKAVGRQLRSLGYQVIEAADARAALAVIEDKHVIDLMLSDLVMPGMDGRQLATLVTAARPEIEVLFMSGYTEHVTMRSSTLVPNDRLLAKPFTQKQLSTAILRVLRNRKLAA
jgi:PAS domain S-box-containing protein